MTWGTALCATAVAAAACAVASPCAAQGEWSAGFGLVLVDSNYRADEVVGPVPMISYRGERLRVGSEGLQFALLREGGGLELDLVARPRLQLIDFDDEPALSGVRRPKSTLELGVEIRQRVGAAVLAAEVRTDMLGVHDGQVAGLELDVDLADGPVVLAPGARIEWRSAEFVDYYYGVGPGEAREGRPPYRGRAAVVPSLSLNIRYPLTYQLWAVASGTYEFAPDEIGDSPLADGNGAGLLAVGFMYDF